MATHTLSARQLYERHLDRLTVDLVPLLNQPDQLLSYFISLFTFTVRALFVLISDQEPGLSPWPVLHHLLQVTLETAPSPEELRQDVPS